MMANENKDLPGDSESPVEKTLKINIDDVLGTSPAVQARLKELEDEKARKAAAKEAADKATPVVDAEALEAKLEAKLQHEKIARAASESGSKSFVELLNADLSWETLRQVMTYEIPTPFSNSGPANLADMALSEGWVTEAQLDDLKRSQKIASDQIGQIMVERGLITNEQLAEAQVHKSRTGQPLWRTLMQLRMLVPEDVSNMLRSDFTLPFGQRPKTPFYEWLVANDRITLEQLDDAWSKAKEEETDFLTYLRQADLLTDQDIAEAMAKVNEVAYDSLETVVEIAPRLLRLVPASVLLRYHALPYRIEDKSLYIAFADENNLQDMQRLGLMLEYEVVPVIAPRGKLSELIAEFVPKEHTDFAVGNEEDLERLEKSGKVMPAVEMLTVVLRGLIRSEATDIHFEPQRTSVRIRYRVDGILHDIMSVSPAIGLRMATRVQNLAGMYMGNSTLPLDGHLTMVIDEQELQFRVSSIPAIHGVKLAMRLVQSDLAFCNFEPLGMEIEHRRLLNDILNAPNGIILTTGPTGSGKTTTLYACLNVMDCFTNNVMTIEDPVEYDVAGVSQIQVNNKTGLTFSVGLRAMLRQDPDIIMIGEIRDQETADIAVRAAMTGQLVLSTLHANSAPAAVNSLLHLGVRPFLLSSALRGIVFQRLVRRICEDCRESYAADEATVIELGLTPGEPVTLYRGKGCASCFQTGYKGRTGVYEILEVNEEFRQAVAESAPPKRLAHAAARAGMLSLREHAVKLVLAGVTTVDEMATIC